MKNFKAFCVTAALLSVALTSVCYAADAPYVDTDKESRLSHDITIQNVPKDCQSMQITLSTNMAVDPKDFSFDPDLERPHIYTTANTANTDGKSITLYVTSKTALSEQGSLSLGALSKGAQFSITGASGLRFVYLRTNNSVQSAVSYEDAAVTLGAPSTPSSPGGGGGGGGAAALGYGISVADGLVNGTVSISQTHAAAGAAVSFTVSPNTGYLIDTVSAADAKGAAIALTNKGDGRYEFTMPAADVTIRTAFKASGEQPLPMPFSDIKTTDWFYDAVIYAVEHGLMNGTGNGQFSPRAVTTRGTIVTILHRGEGTPAVSGAPTFTDVPSGRYYSDAIAWAAKNGIVDGYGSGKFGPDDPITREQMAAILARYAAHKGIDTTATGTLTQYTDAGQVGGYAKAAMQWAVQTGLIRGVSDTALNPKGSASRAEAATILMRFLQNAVKP